MEQRKPINRPQTATRPTPNARPQQNTRPQPANAKANAANMDRRARMRQELESRANLSASNVDDKGRYRSFFNPEKTQGVSFFKAAKGEYMFDPVPYFAGKHDPMIPEGKSTYLLDLFVHTKIGPTEDSYVCPAQYKGKRCPICEERARRSNDNEDYDTRIKPLNTSRRSIYNVIIRDNGKEEAKGVQVFEIAHYFMERCLVKQAKNPKGGRIPWHDFEEGSTVCFERTGTGKESTKYEGHKFIPREVAITDEDLDSAHTLDELIYIPTEKELKDALYGTEEEVEENNEYQDQDDDSVGFQSDEVPF